MAIAVAVPALAADIPKAPPLIIPAKQLPAVSGVNAKIGAFGGSIDGLSGGGVLGALSVPLHDQWGLQVDGLAGSAGGSSFWGAAGHLFWRDPSKGLLGGYASWVDWSPIGAEVGKAGVEGELYSGQFSFEGILAAQWGTFSGLAATATVAYYVQDNLRLDASYRLLQGVGSIGTVGVEWQHQDSGLALFGNASWGAGGYQTFLGGVKFYTGPQKSLIRRHREDDPGVGLPLDLFTCGRPYAAGVAPVEEVQVIDGVCITTLD
jgi:hypothetical protein